MGRPPRPPARPLTALARASTAAFGRVVGDAAPGRPTRLDSHPGGVRLGQTPGGNGCTAYSAGDRRTRLGRSAAVGHRGLDGHAGGTFVALDGHHIIGAIRQTCFQVHPCAGLLRQAASSRAQGVMEADRRTYWSFRRSWSAGRRNARAVELTGSGAAVGWWSKIPHPPWPSRGSHEEPWTMATRKKASGRTPREGGVGRWFFFFGTCIC